MVVVTRMPRMLFGLGQAFLFCKQLLATAHLQRLVITLPPTLKTVLLYDLGDVSRIV